MTFPFIVSYNRRLKATITPDNQHTVLQYIMESILDDKANNVVVHDMHVTYQGSTSAKRGSLFGSVDYGIFSLSYKDDTWWLNYEINMSKLFIFATILSTIVGVFMLSGGGPWWIGIASFFWLGGVNWIISVIRHETVATDIAAGIDDLICGKITKPEQDKMTGELKSWF